MGKQGNEKGLQSTVKDQAQGVFKRWDESATIRKDDSFGRIVIRILIRIGGIIGMIVFSPFLILALLIAFFIAL